jgi:protein phosphatase
MSTTGQHRLPRNDIEVGCLTDMGMVRSENQDDYCYYEPESDEDLLWKGRLLVVCDGMGGHNGGTVASRTTVQAIRDSFRASATRNLKRLLSIAIDRANVAVREKGARDITLRNMGTTCVALAVRGSKVQVAHIGDSRAYLFRDGKIERITRDHTYLNDLIEIGLLSPEKARTHPEKNIITRCVGMGDVLNVDFNSREAKPGDLFLLCSDGLYNHVEDEEMRDLTTRLEPQAACQAMVDLANQRGGEDNITVAIFRIQNVPEAFAAVNAEDDDDAETPEHPTPVLTLEPGEPTPREAHPVVDDQGDTVESAMGLASPPAAAPLARKSSLKSWLLLIAVEIVILFVLQLLIRGY